MSTQTLHFKAGADTGILLLTIAHEHLLYSNDIDKALRMFTESLGGEVPEDMAYKLLSGEMLVTVDVEEQMFGVVERKDHPELENLYPKQIDFNELLAKKQKELDKHVESLDESLNAVINRFGNKEYYALDVPIKSMMKYIYGKDDEFIAELMDELEYDDDMQQMKSLIRITKDFIEKSANLARMFKRLDGMYSIYGMLHTKELIGLAQKIQEIARADFYTFIEGEGDVNVLDAYMVASKDIDVAIEEGLKPVDIMNNYSAGWLSPEGVYYALNGEIANYLHNQIGVELQKQELIPMWDEDYTEELGVEVNPDAWLEKQGWVKIHDNNIQFAGCLNHKLSGDVPNVHMTQVQKDMIYKYLQVCHGGIVRAGWKMEKISAARFQMTDDLMLAKQYFSFD